MIIWKEDKKTGVSCGINDNGDLFLGNDYSGYNIVDTKENRELVLKDFERYTSSK